MQRPHRQPISQHVRSSRNSRRKILLKQTKSRMTKRIIMTIKIIRTAKAIKITKAIRITKTIRTIKATQTKRITQIRIIRTIRISRRPVQSAVTLEAVKKTMQMYHPKPQIKARWLNKTILE